MYLYSKNGDLKMTAVTYPNNWLRQNDTYFTPGCYRSRSIPDIYIKPNYSNIDWDRAINVTFHSEGIFFLGDADVKNSDNSFRYMRNSITDYKESLYIDSIRNTFYNAEDTVFLWSNFR